MLKRTPRLAAFAWFMKLAVRIYRKPITVFFLGLFRIFPLRYRQPTSVTPAQHLACIAFPDTDKRYCLIT